MTQRMLPADYYRQQLQFHQEKCEVLNTRFRRISAGRLGAICGTTYFIYFTIAHHGHFAGWIGIGSTLAAFLWLMQRHTRISEELRLEQTLCAINTRELDFLEHGTSPFEDGSSYLNAHHPYSYDLDLFGPHSLYQSLNRTRTVKGSIQLADALLHRSDNTRITDRQQAIRELTELPEWRQHFIAKAELANDTPQLVQTLSGWSDSRESFSQFFIILTYFLTALVPLSLSLAIATGFQSVFSYLITSFFILNLIVLSTRYKHISREIAFGDKIHRTILRYSQLLQAIESHEWKSPYMQNLRLQLISEGESASSKLKKLSEILNAVESIQNGFGAIVMNGFFLYHLHAYRKLHLWKQRSAADFDRWTAIIAEIELLHSFANFAQNNPEFTYPVLNDNHALRFVELGHPLIKSHKRVSNSVDFTDKPFIVLTGSNMSGKSTFLRTLGVNLVLANAGAPVCAKEATFHPLDLLVSMRLSDSLSDSESYFFAEIKRLQEIMQELEHRHCFILLDEILRGTNSDDKRTGTIEVLKRIIARNATGVIATHDLEVCQTSYEFPAQLTNKCFEVEILNNDLHFDYKLRDGICRNKSATFLMKKMGVI